MQSELTFHTSYPHHLTLIVRKTVPWYVEVVPSRRPSDKEVHA